MVDTYRTVAKEIQVEIKIERSRFIGQVRPIESEQNAKEYIAKIGDIHRQATHNCWAYRVDPMKDIRFSSDAGEPSGTAGEPILRAILSQEVTNTVVVVTRYFGGRKLGIRGLIEAYGTVALEALKAAGAATKLITEIVKLTVQYPQLDQCLHLVAKYNGQMITSDYQQMVVLQVAIPRSKIDDFCGEAAPLTCSISCPTARN